MPADPWTRMFCATLLTLFFAQACASKQTALSAPAALQSETRASQEPTPTPPGPPIFLHQPEVLARHKARYAADPQHPEPALLRLLDDARKALAQKPFSVTEKTVLPPSGDKHDYLSLAPYAWPDASKPNGLPYVQRDGKVNPERDSIADHALFSRIVAMTETLGLAYYLTGDESYAEHAALLLRTFFVEPATRMNPNLNFAQGVRGKESGRAAGIIDAAGVARLVDGVGLLSESKSLLKTDRDGLLAWFRDYLTWLRESELGRREGQAKNNHGTWYDVQVAALALATGQVELAREILQFSHKRRIGRQIDPDGRQPEELQRTKSWHYSIYNLQAMVALANLGDRAGVDLWHYQTPDGRSIRKAIDWLIPFALGDKPWTTPEIGGFKPEALWPIVREAASRLQDTDMETLGGFPCLPAMVRGQQSWPAPHATCFAEVAARLGQQQADRLWLLVE